MLKPCSSENLAKSLVAMCLANLFEEINFGTEKFKYTNIASIIQDTLIRWENLTDFADSL